MFLKRISSIISHSVLVLKRKCRLKITISTARQSGEQEIKFSQRVPLAREEVRALGLARVHELLQRGFAHLPALLLLRAWLRGRLGWRRRLPQGHVDF